MSMNPVPRELTIEDKELIEQYLKDGGAITKGISGQQTEDIEYKGGFYGNRKKKKAKKDAAE